MVIQYDKEQSLLAIQWCRGQTWLVEETQDGTRLQDQRKGNQC